MTPIAPIFMFFAVLLIGRGLEIDVRRLSRDLGVPVVATAARFGEGLPELLQAIEDVATGRFVCRPHRLATQPKDLQSALAAVSAQLLTVFPGLPNARWVAMRLLDGDDAITAALRSGELGRRDRNGAQSPTEAFKS